MLHADARWSQDLSLGIVCVEDEEGSHGVEVRTYRRNHRRFLVWRWKDS